MKIIKSTAVVALVMLTMVSLNAEDKTVEGELVDVTCYSGGAKGSGHKMCAMACAANGQPIGVAAKDGKVYTLLTLAPMMKDHMAKTIKVIGELHVASQSIKPSKMFIKVENSWKEIEIPKAI